MEEEKVVENPAEKEIALEPKPERKFHFTRKILGIFALMAFLIIVLGYYFVSSEMSKKIAYAPTTIPTTSPKTESTSVLIASGFSFSLPKNWSARISENSKNHFFGRFYSPNYNKTQSYFEIETVQTSKLIKNPLLKLGNATTQAVNGLSAQVSDGTENFEKSTRVVNLANVSSGPNSFIITSYSVTKDSTAVKAEFNNLLASVSVGSKNQSYSSFIESAYAEESIGGFNIDKYTLIDVMTEYSETLTKQDISYNNGYSKLFKFQAFKGQRLATNAYEFPTDKTEQELHSELYDESGKQLYARATRVEFNAPETGIYYLIVYGTIGGQDRVYRFEIFDADQTENLAYIKYQDGTEREIDTRLTPPQYGENIASLAIQFTSPITLNGSTVYFVPKPSEFRKEPTSATLNIKIFAKEMSFATWISKSGPNETGNEQELVEEHSENLIPTKLTQVTPSKVIIEPSDGGIFPNGSQIGGYMRDSYTEIVEGNPAVISFPFRFWSENLPYGVVQKTE